MEGKAEARLGAGLDGRLETPDEGTPEEMGMFEGSLDMTGEAFEGISAGTPDGTIDDAPEVIVKGVSEGTLERRPDGPPKTPLEVMLEGPSVGRPKVGFAGMLDGMLQSEAEGTADGRPEGTVKMKSTPEALDGGIQPSQAPAPVASAE